MVATSDPTNCTPNTEYLQNTVGSTPGFAPSYDVPATVAKVVVTTTATGQQASVKRSGIRLRP